MHVSFDDLKQFNVQSKTNFIESLVILPFGEQQRI